MRIKRIDFSTPPVNLTQTLSVEGGVPGRQTFDTDFDEFVPDYSIVPLVLQPRVGAVGRGGNEMLSNVQWLIGDRALDLFGNMEQRPGWIVTPEYDIAISGMDAGRLVLKCNPAMPGSPATLTFAAKYLDALSGQLLDVQMSYLLFCDTSTTGQPRLELGAATTTLYNPLRSADMQAISAMFYVGTRECPEAKYSLHWQVLDGTWRDVGTDLHLSVSSGSKTLTVNRALMGDRCDVRCVALYTPGAGMPVQTYTQTCTIIRRIPALDYDIVDVPDNIPQGQRRIYPSVVVKDSTGDVPTERVTRDLTVAWHIVRNYQGAAHTSYGSPVALGTSASIPTDKMDAQYGAVLGVDVSDYGAFLPIADADNDILIDNNNDIFLI